jgi:hypothetical protein
MFRKADGVEAVICEAKPYSGFSNLFNPHHPWKALCQRHTPTVASQIPNLNILKQ